MEKFDGKSTKSASGLGIEVTACVRFWQNFRVHIGGSVAVLSVNTRKKNYLGHTDSDHVHFFALLYHIEN